MFLSDFLALQEGLSKFSDAYLFDKHYYHSRSQKPWVRLLKGDKDFLLQVEVPGIDISSLDIEVKENILVLKGEYVSSLHSLEDIKVLRKEFNTSSFHRNIELPDGVDGENIEASFNASILTIKLPLKEKVSPKKITVKLEK